jgi:hypothetical protein
MKTNQALFTCALACLFSCKKDPAKPMQQIALPSQLAGVVTSPDTIPDGACLKIKLVKDSTNYDETMIRFNHTATKAYNPGEDAVYLMGFGQEHLASLSYDSTDLAINSLQYMPDMSVGLDIHARLSGVYRLQLSYRKNIPSGIQVWLKDAYRKDSLEISHYNYYFDLYQADTASFGRNRFSLVIRPGA